MAEARALYNNGKYDGAAYLCGYAVETALKARICRTLRWEAFPETNREFNNLQSFKTHDLEVLLSLSGIEARIYARHSGAWTRIKEWNPELRYRPVGTTPQQRALEMIEAAAELLGKM